jgi:hypothetical protein
MSTDHDKQSQAGRHQEVWDLVPWYINGTLKNPLRPCEHIPKCV